MLGKHISFLRRSSSAALCCPAVWNALFNAKLSPKCSRGFFCECIWVKLSCKSIITTKEALLRFTIFLLAYIYKCATLWRQCGEDVFFNMLVFCIFLTCIAWSSEEHHKFHMFPLLWWNFLHNEVPAYLISAVHMLQNFRLCVYAHTLASAYGFISLSFSHPLFSIPLLQRIKESVQLMIFGPSVSSSIW